MDFRLKITIQARRDFNSIWRHIGNDDPQAAKDFGQRLLDRARSLTTFPHRHGTVAGQPNIRKVPVRSYLIFYKIHDEEKVVEILRFWHGARNQNRLHLREAPEAVYGLPATVKQEA